MSERGMPPEDAAQRDSDLEALSAVVQWPTVEPPQWAVDQLTDLYRRMCAEAKPHRRGR